MNRAKLTLFFLAYVWVTNPVTLADEYPGRIGVGQLIESVISGEDFVGKEFVISGIALSSTQFNNTGSTGGGVLHVGTKATYQSGVYTNFVSIYGVTSAIAEGDNVLIWVSVEESSATKIGSETYISIILTKINRQ